MSATFVTIDRSRRYRRVYIVESRAWWAGCQGEYDADHDLVLTFDFGLRRAIEASGGRSFYVDYLVAPEVMEANNHLTYEFFRRWFLDAQGNDLFTWRGIPFGFSFRIDIWNDLIFTTRLRLCLEELASLQFESLHAGTHLGLAEKLLTGMGLPFTAIPRPQEPSLPEYLFPIHRWMDEKVRSRKWRHRIKPMLALIFGKLRGLLDRVSRDRRLAVFVQEYYPTRALLERLQRDRRFRVVLAQYSWAPGAAKFFTEQPIPMFGGLSRYASDAQQLLENFRQRRATRFVLANSVDFTAGIFEVIEARVATELADALRCLDSVMHALDRTPLRLQVMISNLGRVHGMVDSVCRARGVRSYLIINGILAHAYLDEGKYADVINAYSPSIRDNYFRGAKNVVCLGDPRMDAYAKAPQRTPNRRTPTISIGASGHNVTNLGSYVAVEFEFLHDVLEALDTLRRRGVELRVVVKVRDNGYREQYEAFAREYFPALAPEILAGTPIRSLFERTDFYISIYSQTLFEASCLGIPALYYKKDTETLFAPFDGNTELVSVDNVADLVGALEDFLAASPRFDAFLRHDVMEKYIGPLDGNNLARNLEFVEGLLDAPPVGAGA